MDIRGYLRFYCNRCRTSKAVFCDLGLDTVTSIKNSAVKYVRAFGWTVTRQQMAYCPSCWLQIVEERKKRSLR